MTASAPPPTHASGSTQGSGPSSTSGSARGLTSSGARLIVTTVAAGCATVLLCLPQAVAPRSPPALWPEAAEAELAQTLLAEERIAAAAESYEGRALERLRALQAEQGRAEVGPGEAAAAAHERALGLQRLLSLVAQENEGAVEALRAQALVQLWPALRGDLDADAEQVALGSFPRMLERYGAARDGRRLAPKSVVHAMFKARWNVMHGLEQTDGFSDAEAQAFWGWAALHAPNASEDFRYTAIQGYARAHGPATRELLAYAAYQERSYARAASLYADLFEETGKLRFRNHARAALLMAQ